MIKLFKYIARTTGRPYYITFIDGRRYYAVFCGEYDKNNIERQLPRGQTIRGNVPYLLYKGEYSLVNDAIFIGRKAEGEDARRGKAIPPRGCRASMLNRRKAGKRSR